MVTKRLGYETSDTHVHTVNEVYDRCLLQGVIDNNETCLHLQTFSICVRPRGPFLFQLQARPNPAVAGVRKSATCWTFN